MAQSQKRGETRSPRKWKLAVCLLLAVLSLYNPYLTAMNGTTSLSICHSASHRATVGASELQPLSTFHNRHGVAFGYRFLTTIFAVLPPAGVAYFTRVYSSVPSAGLSPLLYFSLRFRPPPQI
jgi:hypothetical protein